MKKDLLLVLTIECVVFGVVLGFVVRPFNPRFDQESITIPWQHGKVDWIFQPGHNQSDWFPRGDLLATCRDDDPSFDYFFGDLWSSALFNSVIIFLFSALAQVRPKDARRIGCVTVVYYMITTFLSTFVSLTWKITTCHHLDRNNLGLFNPSRRPGSHPFIGWGHSWAHSSLHSWCLSRSD